VKGRKKSNFKKMPSDGEECGNRPIYHNDEVNPTVVAAELHNGKRQIEACRSSLATKVFIWIGAAVISQTRQRPLVD